MAGERKDGVEEINNLTDAIDSTLTQKRKGVRKLIYDMLFLSILYLPSPEIELVIRHILYPSDMDEDENIQQPLEYFKAATPTYTEHGPLKGKLLLKSKLRHGRISHAPEDVEFLSPDFLGLADHKTQWFPEKYRHIDEIQLKIMLVENKPLLCIGDPGIEMGDNDLLLLKTRVRKGLVSFHNDDLEIRYPGWKIPVHILEDLQRNASNGKLFIISDEKGHLRCSVRSGVTEVANRLVGVRDKAFEFITSNVFKTTL